MKVISRFASNFDLAPTCPWYPGNLVPSAGATLAGLPAGVLYRVRATYRYNREDSDELSFDVGDTIRVVEYDDPEEQVLNIIQKTSINDQ